MAKKKKVSHSNNTNSLHKLQDVYVMDSDKLENLKSLNQMLLKEAFERRQQVDSLTQSNGLMELELTRLSSEKEALRSELASLSESDVRSELERSVVSLFVALQLGEKGEAVEREMVGLEREVRELKGVVAENECEIGMLNGEIIGTERVLENEREVLRRICTERDELKSMLDGHIAVRKRIKEDLFELRKRNRHMEQEIGELRVAYDGLVVEKELRERMFEYTASDNDSFEISWVKLKDDLNQTKEAFRLVVREMEAIEESKNAEVAKRCELENVVSELGEFVVTLQKEEQRLLVNVAELENKCVESEEKQKVMRKKIDRLLEERKFSEKSVEELIDEQIVLEKKLQEALIHLHDVKCKFEDLVKQKIGLLEAKGRLDCDVGSFQKQVADLKTVILRLEESNKVRESKVKSLESEVVNYTCKLKRVEAEKGKLGNCLDEEKQNVVKLKEKMENMEMKLEESVKGAGEVKAENGALLVERIDLENQCESLKKEIASLKSALDEAQNELCKMKGNVELADAKSELVMSMLNRTLTFCLKGESETKDGDLCGKEISCEEAKQCGMKFEMIENAFKVKEAKVDSMRKQLEFLKNYVEEAHKKKSLWADLSFATILLAAVFLAYIARGYFGTVRMV